MFRKIPTLVDVLDLGSGLAQQLLKCKRYLALIFAMGLISQSDINEYWSTDPVTFTPFFPVTMSRDRFLLITSFFHLVNNDSYIPRGQPGHDPLFKLGSVYKRIVDRFFSSYTPHQYISLDEGMIPGHGHLSFRVYSPDKPVKYGIRAYMLSTQQMVVSLNSNPILESLPLVLV